MSTSTRKTPAKTPEVTKYDVADLPKTGSLQFRQNGDYKPAITALSAFAKTNPIAKGHVKALIHLGWVKPGGVNSASKSTAFTIANSSGLSPECFTVGALADEQISANMKELAEMGAPAEALDALWSAYVGV